MARTEEGALLTVRHRQSQIALRAQTLRDFQRIWPVWTGDESTFKLLVSATIPLVGLRRQTSSALGLSYYEMFRRLEGAEGSPTPRTADPVPDKVLTTSLYVTGFNSVLKSIEAGFSPQAAKQNAFVKVSGALTRHTLNGSREAILRSTADDKVAKGHQRVAGGGACAFCAMLASRGPAYYEDTVDFMAHDFCTCESEPFYDGSELPADSQRYREVWNDTIKPERYFDERRGIYKWRNPPDALNQFRQALAAKAE